jgi:adenylate cyclase class 2
VSRIEVEVKLRVKDREGVCGRLVASGALLRHPREFEDNRLYDFPDRGLGLRGSMLRIRSLERAAYLTYKGPSGVVSGAKVRDEIEAAFPASEAEALTAIISALGLVPVFRYQKYRTTWETPGLLITLDETPIGDYMELEGEPTLIESMAGRLGYKRSDFITASYRDLFLHSREGRAASPDEMVFP